MNTTTKKIGELKPGDKFCFGGYDWTLLDDVRGTAITTDIIAHKAFDNGNSNDWRGSSLRKWLNREFCDSLGKSGIANLLGIMSSLLADDGMRNYGGAEDLIALLSCDQYRQYRDVIPPLNSIYWTLTPKTCISTIRPCVQSIDVAGAIMDIGADVMSASVRPIIRLRPDTLVEVDEPDKRKYTVCAICGAELGEKYYADILGDADDEMPCCSYECALKTLIAERDNVRED